VHKGVAARVQSRQASEVEALLKTLSSPEPMPWYQRRLKPSPKLLKLLFSWLVFALVLLLVRLVSEENALMPGIATTLWWLTGATILLTSLYDAHVQNRLQQLRLTREVTESLSVGVDTTITLSLVELGPHPVQIQVFDHFCQKLSSDHLPLQVTVTPGQVQMAQYVARPLERGDAQFQGCEVWALSPHGFWAHRLWFHLPKIVRIYPNFAALAKASALGIEAHMNRMGIHLLQRRGQGMDFKQLRAFQVGDALRQVDWKATSKRSKAIVREYQDEQGQEVIFMLDCGRSMRAKDEGLSHFDAALNAVLMVAFTALRQGDRIGLQAFAGQSLWQPPVTGVSGVNTLLQRVYDLHSTTAGQDYLMAAQQFLARHSKRSVLIIVTNLRTSLTDDLLEACRLLSRRHVVCLVSVKEKILSSVRDQTPETLNQALEVCSAASLIEQRQRRLKALRHQGVVAIEAFAHQLHHEVIRQYQALKRSGRA